MPRVVTITDEPNQMAEHHAFTHPPAQSRSPFNSHRNAASPKRVAVLHLRHVTITDEPSLFAVTSRIHISVGAATIAVQLASKRGIAKTRCSSPPPPPPPPEIRKAACRHNHRRAKSFRGNFTHSHIRRRRHDRRSTRIETRHRQSDTIVTGRIQRHETASFKHPSIRCYRSSSRYQ
ncbi:hypothetical protein NP493_757g00000 [Ridgeia piscesae]|uniref:Uncharacterized protein n=1 Tax=Ridgeia piscesae TaxID=27915 RepID=A0AAD9KPZ6_RIDPI|nr:hypothetical protein NP493_757g00000 [Ridgeia piscesae]